MPHKKHIQISIPQPCDQAWTEMRSTGNGRFCEHCQAVVTDFTQLADGEVTRLMTGKNPPRCGRFLASQLGRPMEVATVTKRPYWPKFAVAAMLTIATTTQTGWGQSVISQVTAPHAPGTLYKPPLNPDGTLAEWLPISGKVVLHPTDHHRGVDDEIVFIEGLGISTKTDRVGHFELRVPLDQVGDSFVVALAPYNGDLIRITVQKSDLPMELIVQTAPVDLNISVGGAILKEEYVLPKRDEIPLPSKK